MNQEPITDQYGAAPSDRCGEALSSTVLLSHIEALRECLEEAVAITRCARIGTIGATRVHTPQINVKAVERWRRVLRDNS